MVISGLVIARLLGTRNARVLACCAGLLAPIIALSAAPAVAQVRDGGMLVKVWAGARSVEVAARLGLSRCSVVPVAASISPAGVNAAATNGTLTLELTPPSGVATTFTLESFSLRAADFKLMIADDDGVKEVAAPAPTTYHGRSAAGDEVWTSIYRGEVHAVIITANDPLHPVYIQPAGIASAPGDERVMHAVYTGADVLAKEHTCGVVDCGSCKQTGQSTTAPSGFADRGPGGCRYMRVVVDCDYPMYQQNSFDVGATIRSVESVMLGVNQVYVNAPFNAEPRFTISRMAVRTTNTADPYNTFPLIGGDAGAILTQISSTWSGVPLIDRTFAHLFTGRETYFTSGGVTSNPIGLANVGGMCSGAVGLSETNFSSILASRIALTAHEIGHNFGMTHDASGATTMMAPSISTPAATTFSAASVTTFNTFLTNQATCGATATTDVQPDGGSTIKNRAIRIDVLANDGRAAVACPTVVTGFTLPATTTALGGTVAVSAGTGPGGRNEVLYTPPAGIEGASDTFSYLAASITVPVVVDIQIPRAPDGAAGASPGLTATYYNTWPNGNSNSWWVWDLPPTDFSIYTIFGTPVTLTQLNTNTLLPGFARGLSAVIVGYVQIPTSDYWTFTLSARSSARLYIGGESFLLAPNSVAGADVSATRALGAGLHAVRVDYHYGPSTPPRLVLDYASTTQARITIPASGFFREIAPPITCPADFNQSGGISVQDIFDFLAAYFSNSPAADYNQSGTISVQDIFDFLAAYFTGCP